MFESIINPILGPLLDLNPIVAIIIISFGISFVITIAYKMFTDQELMKELKADMKKTQKEMKEFSKDPGKVMSMQKEAMKKNMEYMKHSMKPTLITFLPIIIIFGWLNANFAFVPIMPDTDFTTTMVFDENIEGDVELIVSNGIVIKSGESRRNIKNSMAKWTLSGREGDYILEYKFKGNSYTKELLITSEHGYKDPVEKVGDQGLKEIKIDNKPMKPFGDFSIFGWRPGWLGAYIIFSLVFSIGLRKVMKIH
jgi:uncharacterized membrane protein (DUF106 family)